MHKDIVEAIQSICKKYNERKEVFEVFIQSQETGGFWSMVIFVEADNHYFIPHIKSIADSIGRMYGESLFIRKEKDYVRLS